MTFSWLGKLSLLRFQKYYHDFDGIGVACRIGRDKKYIGVIFSELSAAGPCLMFSPCCIHMFATLHGL